MAAHGVCIESELEEVWDEYRRTGDVTLRNKILNCYLESTRILSAKLYKSRNSNIADFDDYLHYGLLGLTSAIDRFDPDYGVKFFSYASHRIKGSIIDGISSMEERTASSANMLIYHSRLESIASQGVEAIDVFEELVETSVLMAIGIILEQDEPDCNQYKNKEFGELKDLLISYINNLDKQERVIIQYHYFHQVSFVTIAEILQVTKARVSQLHKQALLKLRNACRSTLNLEI